jgi:catechol 2,3-dioxygenase-like lactoylglutathione lyase family enzyme
MKYKHTNLIARDWQLLARFYEEVFGCERVLPERHLSGRWLDVGTGVRNAQLSGVHLRLPGHGDNGPTLEVFSYSDNLSQPAPAANREGYGHIAFEVEDVARMMERVLTHGGRKVGEIASAPIEGVGILTFVYLADPEGNIIELQSWR